MSSDHPLPTLAAKGFLLQAVLDIATLPDWVMGPISEAGFHTAHHTRLVMLGQAGPALWEAMDAQDFRADDRCDEYSRAVVTEWIEGSWPKADHDVVYPGDTLLPLGRLAEHVGWGRPSPLGLTIHPEYGLWIAHRIVFLTDVALPVTPVAARSHPCDTCVAMPCITACPVNAVSADQDFDVATCASHRIAAGSSCALECLARNACPVGATYRYGSEQMAHHYGSGLDSIRRYAAGAP